MKKISLSIICICFVFTLHAQEKHRQKIRSYKIAYITEKLDLNSNEAEKFWPVYNTFEERMQQYRKQKLRGVKQQLKGTRINDISEGEAKEILTEIESVEENLYLERKKYIKTLQQILPAKKILLLKKVEDDFNRQLLSRLRERRESRPRKN